jgi:hypothetical protein
MVFVVPLWSSTLGKAMLKDEPQVPDTPSNAQNYSYKKGKEEVFVQISEVASSHTPQSGLGGAL